MNAVTLDLSPVIKLTDEQFYKLATAHPDLRMERTPTGKIVIMPPTGGNTGKRNADLTTDLNIWNRQTRLGVVFDSSTEFNLPNAGDRSPDASWIRLERWNALSREEQETFPPICPDFVIELRSPSDRLTRLQSKMREYLRSGLRLGWLIDPKNRRVEIYRQGREVEVLESPATLSGEDVLPEFVLDLKFVFE
jgi:Uma2 family endonuclease